MAATTDADPRRDATLAAAALVALLAVGAQTVGSTAFLDPVAVAVGVTGALAVEVGFVRYPERALAVWDCPGVALAGAGAVVCLGVAALWVAPWLLGALAWGLVTYFGLLACVLVGPGNPVAWLPGLGERRT